MRRCLSSFVKTIMQTQVTTSFGCLQLRRDFYLSGAKSLSSDAIQQLRHAPAVDATSLFPRDLLATLNIISRSKLKRSFASLQFRSVATETDRDVVADATSPDAFPSEHTHRAVKMVTALTGMSLSLSLLFLLFLY